MLHTLWTRRLTLAVWAIPLLVLIIILATVYVATAAGRVSDQEVVLLAQDRLSPGSPAAVRAVVRDWKTGEPVKDAAITVKLAPKGGGPARTVFEGRTDASGTAPIVFKVPEGVQPQQTLIVEARSGLGQDRVEKAVTVQRTYKLLLTTDKPLYQPGQTIHIRALALSALDRTPANQQTIQFTVEDARGNKVFRKAVQTSAYGVASADFTLANEVNSGSYKVTAQIDQTTSEKTITVKPYVLPKFQVKVETDRAFYQPGQRLVGIVSADYFFGKPVAGGEVQLQGFVYTVGREQVVDLKGKTDANGKFTFDLTLPSYFVGGTQGDKTGSFGLEVAVTDQAKHVEQSAKLVPVARDPILIDAVPEAGRLKPGVENKIFLLTAYPDGAPAETELDVSAAGKTVRLKTGPYGLAEFAFTPTTGQTTLQITARDARGNRVQKSVNLAAEQAQEYVLLRPERAAYRVGETLHLDVFSAPGTLGPIGTKAGTATPVPTRGSDTVYLDIIKEGQAISTRTLDLKDGRAAAEIDLDDTLLGTLQLHAYKVLRDASIVRDTRLVLVGGAPDLKIDIKPDRDSYRPGEGATIRFQTTRDGKPVPAALGITAVDESVFALQEQDAGFAKLYFLLQKELLQPKYDIHGLEWDTVLYEKPAPAPEALKAQDTTAKAALAQAGIADIRAPFKSHEQKVRDVAQRQQNLYKILAIGLSDLLILIPVVALGIALVSLARRRSLVPALLGMAVIAIVAMALAMVLPAPPWNPNAGLLDRLSYALEGLGNGAGVMLLCVPLVGLIGLVATALFAWQRRDAGLKFTLLLMVAWVALVIPLVFVLSQASPVPLDEKQAVATAAAFLGFVLTFLLHAAGFGYQRQPGPALATFGLAVGVVVFPIIVMVPMFAFSGRFALGAGAPGRPQIVEMAAGARGVPPVRELAVPAAAPMATPAPAAVQAADAEKVAGGAAPAGQEAPRLRQFFPETLYVNPQVVTGDDGLAEIRIPMADSVTTWRLSALASSQKGELGSATVGLRAFQDFFIDLDLPIALTQNDEVAVPVAVFNYLSVPQQVRLELKQEPWFEMLGEPVQTMTIEANDVDVRYFRIKAAQFGQHKLTVTAYGEKMSDAIAKDIQVVPDGKMFRDTASDRLSGKISKTLLLPADAIPGTGRIWLKVYPGVVSQVVEGLEGMLRMPMGCFEQTSSLTYPNVLVTDYLKTTKKGTPEILLKAETYIAQGYQRLLTFEVAGGGFSLFGQPPANVVLTSYGLMEFKDMSRVYEIDPAVIQRTAKWLISQQSGDGSWRDTAGFVHEATWGKLSNQALPITAYVTWALVEGGYKDDAAVGRGIAYVQEHATEATDPYVMALVANALVAHDPKDGVVQNLLGRLDAQKIVEGDKIYWNNSIASFMGSQGKTGSVETTALIAYALLRSGAFPQTAQGALNYLIASKDSFGSWHSTQATVLALKTLLLAATGPGTQETRATVHVTLNGEAADPIRITPENADVVQIVSFGEKARSGENTLIIEVQGEGNLMYQVTSEYYLPWDRALKAMPARELMTIDVQYDKTELSVNDQVTARVRAVLNDPKATAQSVLVDLGVPPGFTVNAEDLSALVEAKKISRYELAGRQILVYLEKVKGGQPIEFSYRLQARYPIKAKTPASTAYDYYNPETSGEKAPVLMIVLHSSLPGATPER